MAVEGGIPDCHVRSIGGMVVTDCKKVFVYCLQTGASRSARMRLGAAQGLFRLWLFLVH